MNVEATEPTLMEDAILVLKDTQKAINDYSTGNASSLVQWAERLTFMERQIDAVLDRAKREAYMRGRTK